ncbi:MAG TPA: type II toxin-antitoxin system VapC family toxin [Intrasporangium sp.]|uniref:type II toxin-antitoxin system VapC family toxin n=1 Tax=Intrasporangium sp. TaxID=1925024 RepID=UPI002D78F8AD|nr:type II toxin-antitoxin system VapC family toxin [Intrasporangium sp.]HET7399733.1 type II toxin-antitoxin system VapC family toxin [Intrasporangium sp.]
MGVVSGDCLLDTHALLWALTDPARLGAAAHALVADSRVRLHVSAASGWELSTKSRLGKLAGAAVVLDGLDRHLARLGARPLDISLQHALLAGRLDWDHRDPFDRMLAAQSMIESMPLVSKDPAFHEVAGVRVVW